MSKLVEWDRTQYFQQIFIGLQEMNASEIHY